MSIGAAAALVASSFAAGVMNALAGGGTILTFPTLLFLGVPAVSANATSTVGLVPGALASFSGYRREAAAHRDWLRALFLPSLLGGGVGAGLLLATPERLFAGLAPFLVLFATALFGLQALLARGRDDAAAPRRPLPGASAALLQFGVGVYGGYFGAGIGILMLALLGAVGLSDIHAMNGLKNLLGASINAVAAAWFIANGAVVWPLALVMIAGSVAGGLTGARLAKRIGRERVRIAVVLIGASLAAALFLRR